MGDVEARLRECEDRMKQLQYAIAMLTDRLNQATLILYQNAGPTGS